MKKEGSPLMIAAATLMMLFLGILYAWSVFRGLISELYPEFTAAELSLNFTFMMLFFCFGGFLGGMISAARSHSAAMRVAAVLIFIGWFGMSFMGHFEGRAALWVMYIFYGMLSGLGTGVGYNACVTGVSPWFPRHMALCSGVMLMGYGFGSLLLGLAAKRAAAVLGLFTVFRVFSFLLLAVLFGGSFFLKKPPTMTDAAKSAKAGQLDAPDDGRSLRPVQMLATASFWVYFVWNVINSSAGLIIINSSTAIPAYYGAAAWLGLAVSVFNGAGRPVTGVVMDKFGQFRGMLIVNALLIIAGVLLLVTDLADFAGKSVTLCAGMFAVGVCYGAGVTISSRVINDLYGSRYYGVNFSLMQFCSIPASFIGPYISGVMQDSSGGGFLGNFILLTALACVALLLIFILRLCLRKEGRA